MGDFDLTKADKKYARQMINKGLKKEYSMGLDKTENAIDTWEGKIDNKPTYHKLYSSIEKHDARISQIYDRMSGSRDLNTFATQLADGIIDVNDIDGFSEESRKIILLYWRK